MILYGAENCQGCALAKRWLDLNKVAYTYVSLDDDVEAKMLVLNAGVRSVPAMNLDGKILPFNEAKNYLEARFGHG